MGYKNLTIIKTTTNVLLRLLYVLILSVSLLAPLYSNNSCINHIQRTEKLEKIPRNLLAAIARVESGRWNADTGKVEPWPWAVQALGKSNYFENREEAIKHIQSLQKKGIKNIDVGCMQINIGHHGDKFDSLDAMLDPEENVRYAGKFLRQLKDGQATGWSTAVGNYHSATEEHHERYKKLVFKNLKNTGHELNYQSNIRTPGNVNRRGSIYPLANNRIRHVSAASTFPFERRYGPRASKRPHTSKLIIVPSAKKRAALMKGKGVTDLAFMSKK